MALKTDFVDALFEQKKIRLNENGDGTVTPVDETEYTRQGDKFGAKEINATNEAVNGLSEDMVDLKKSVSDGKTQVAAAITAKRVPTAATATFGEMAANIGKIVLGSGNAVPSDVLAGKTFTNDDGVEYTGTMPNRGGYWGWGNSKGNDGGNQRMWVRLPGGYYNENAEVYLSWADIRAMAGLTPEMVKKNEWILGVQGLFEGWVPNPQDLYYNGVNSAGLILLYGWTFENTRIAFYYDSRAGSVPSFRFPNAIDVRSYSRLIFEGYFHWSADSTMYCILNNPTQVSRANFNKGATYVALDISQVVTINANATINMSLDKASGGVCYITRIRLE